MDIRHTAVAMRAVRVLRDKEGEQRKTLVVSTASPYKFAQDVGEALGLAPSADAFKDAEALAAYTHQTLPAPLAALKGLPVRHAQVCDPDTMGQAVLSARDLG